MQLANHKQIYMFALGVQFDCNSLCAIVSNLSVVNLKDVWLKYLPLELALQHNHRGPIAIWVRSEPISLGNLHVIIYIYIFIR